MIKTSFIITARNEPAENLAATLRGLAQTTEGYEREIVLIDDGSESAIADCRDVRLVRNENAIGISRSRRLGATLATGDVLVWLDAHMSFAQGWLQQMLAHADAHSILCSAYWNYALTRGVSYGADYQWHGGRNLGSQRYPGFSVRHRTRYPGPGAVEVPMLIGGCYMMRRDVYAAVGGFSPLSRVRGGNEQDLSARAWISGLKVRCVADAKVGHLWRPRFPYPVEFSQLEFNQLALVHTVFEESTVRELDRCFQPYPPKVMEWSQDTSIAEWREAVQSKRKCSDGEFFARFVRELNLQAIPTPPAISTPRAMRSEHKISFVVTARDEPADVLAATIDGLLATSTGQDREIVIVDDGSQEAVTIERPGTRVVRNAKALGVAQSRRLGAAMTTGDVLVWTDAHMSFAPDWLEEMLRHVDTGALLGASWWNYELTRPLCYGAEFVWCADRDHHAGRSPGLAFRHRTRFPGEGAVEVPMVIGACYMALRESYEHCGGFSPYFRIWGKSEQDVSARMWITGRGVKCVTGARVGHLSRPQFPYPVSWSDIEFNQVVLFRALLEHATLQAVERILGPLPEQVEKRLAEVDLRAWRESIQSRRSMSDFEFFRRFVSDAPASLTALGPNTPMTA